jgi:(4-(4-[2-(gamma-L-glutamylamino)ethyl]phenoxymethyl)furan-2-yl)methanamine synthase
MQATRRDTIGWDLGGANVKLCRLAGGRPAGIAQIPCPIIADPAKFDRAVDAALKTLPGSDAGLHALTMTGELSDVFGSRSEGVAYLVRLMQGIAGEAPLLVYAGPAGFLSPEAAIDRPGEVASANWYATASLAANSAVDGLLVDIGTTTTDLIPFRDGRPVARGYSDGERLTEAELIYTGVVRTPVMALGDRAPFKGRMQGVAAERFATLADVHRLTGALPGGADPYPAADSRGKSPAESAARLARMLGRDAAEAPIEDWIALAKWFAERQRDALATAAAALTAREGLMPDAPIVGAGCGRFVAAQVAWRLGRPYRDFADIAGVSAPFAEMAAIAAPAVSVALLAAALDAAPAVAAAAR